MANLTEEEPLVPKESRQGEISHPCFSESEDEKKVCTDEPSLDPSTYPEVYVMVAGLPRTGKSTALNNLFDLQIEEGPSNRSLTTEVLYECKVKTEDKIIFKVINTSKLRATDASEKIVLHEMKRIGIQKGFLLILTHSMYPSSAISQDFSNTLKNLTTIFGAGVWNWAIILLTHSDTVRMMDYPDDTKKYEEYLKETCTGLEEELKRHGVEKRVKSFTEYQSLDQIQEEDDDDVIIAMPVGRNRGIEATKLLLPLQPWAHEYTWEKLAYLGIRKIIMDVPQTTLKQRLLIELRYNKYILSSEKKALKYGGASGAVTGLVAGAIKGGTMGASSGPWGVAIGITAGAAVGLIAGLSTSTGITSTGLVAHRHYQARSCGQKTGMSKIRKIVTCCFRNIITST